MIEHYTIKCGPAVSQKELEKALREGIESPEIPVLHKLKARIEIVCDYNDLRSIDPVHNSLQGDRLEERAISHS